MKVVKTFYECDVCGKIESTPRNGMPDQWEVFQYQKSWESGAHGGMLDKEFICCPDCHSGKKPYRVFKHLLKLIKKERP